jgi:hypothetical protein
MEETSKTTSRESAVSDVYLSPPAPGTSVPAFRLLGVEYTALLLPTMASDCRAWKDLSLAQEALSTCLLPSFPAEESGGSRDEENFPHPRPQPDHVTRSVVSINGLPSDFPVLERRRLTSSASPCALEETRVGTPVVSPRAPVSHALSWRDFWRRKTCCRCLCDLLCLGFQSGGPRAVGPGIILKTAPYPRRMATAAK